MVYGDWFKNIMNKKKVKGERSQKLKRHPAPGNGFRKELSLERDHGFRKRIPAGTGSSVEEDTAATQIQTAYRAHLARKTLRNMKGMSRLQNFVQRNSVKKQASSTLNLLHKWSMTQAQIRDRRAHMVTEGRLRRKKLENQLKLEAKFHDLQVEWSGGSETIDEAIARIHQREEASVRRERAMAYAFSHQWRANSSSYVGSGNEANWGWGWSWMDRWIAARPWESRVPPRGTKMKKTAKMVNSPTAQQKKAS